MIRRILFALTGAVLPVVGGCQNGALPLSGLPLDHRALRARAGEVIQAASVSDDALLRCHALETLARCPKDPQAAKGILAGLADPAAAVRFAAAVAAGDLPLPAARKKLERLLWDADPSVKLAAAYGLEKMGDTRFTDWYNGALAGDDPRLQAQACLLLGKLPDVPSRPNSRRMLWQVLRQSDQRPLVKLQAAEALARLGDQTVLNKLLAFAGSGYADDRLLAISGLELLGGPNAFAMLVTLADDTQLEVRLGAIRALADRAEDKDVALVRQAIGHTDPAGDANATTRVRALAALALGRVGRRDDGNLLYEALSDPSAYVRAAAARGTLDFLAANETR
ncbi:MAG: HEAT repeat domain-containing protein [Sedimentisphaerales bacterium]|nr:HEAT repeat domain-containing protein [Sedimentisphaerales bacterium]